MPRWSVCLMMRVRTNHWRSRISWEENECPAATTHTDGPVPQYGRLKVHNPDVPLWPSPLCYPHIPIVPAPMWRTPKSWGVHQATDPGWWRDHDVLWCDVSVHQCPNIPCHPSGLLRTGEWCHPSWMHQLEHWWHCGSSDPESGGYVSVIQGEGLPTGAWHCIGISCVCGGRQFGDEGCGERALTTFHTPVRFWKRCGRHLHSPSQGPCWPFLGPAQWNWTVHQFHSRKGKHGRLVFLDVQLCGKDDSTRSTAVYCKLTHTN